MSSNELKVKTFRVGVAEYIVVMGANCKSVNIEYFDVPTDLSSPTLPILLDWIKINFV